MPTVLSSRLVNILRFLYLISHVFTVLQFPYAMYFVYDNVPYARDPRSIPSIFTVLVTFFFIILRRLMRIDLNAMCNDNYIVNH